MNNKHGKQQPGSTRGRWRFGIRRYSAVELLIALVLLFAISPFVQELRHGRGIETVLMTLVLFSALLAVGGRRWTMWGILLAIPAILGRWLHHVSPKLIPSPIFNIAALAFIGFVIAHLLHFVLTTARVDHETLCASISAYLMIGLLWTIGYTLLDQMNRGAFSFSTPGQKMDGFNAFYFSFVTLSTVGYGDVTPISRGARMLAVMEAITGMFYVAVLVARLVSLYSTESSALDRGKADEDRYR